MCIKKKIEGVYGRLRCLESMQEDKVANSFKIQEPNIFITNLLFSKYTKKSLKEYLTNESFLNLNKLFDRTLGGKLQMEIDS